MMITLLVISILLLSFYCFLMLTYKCKWEQVPETSDFSLTPSTFISVVIAARNEAKNISNILSDILTQNYPAALVEIIVIDDHSEDDTFAIVSAIRSTDARVIIYKLAELITTAHTTSAYK